EERRRGAVPWIYLWIACRTGNAVGDCGASGAFEWRRDLDSPLQQGWLPREGAAQILQTVITLSPVMPTHSSPAKHRHLRSIITAELVTSEASSPLRSTPWREPRRIEGRNGRQLALVALHVDQAAVCGAALTQLRAALVERQHIGIAVFVERADAPGL